MTLTIPATEYPKSIKEVEGLSDIILELLYNRMTQVSKDVAKEAIMVEDLPKLASLVGMAQFWGRVAYEELVERKIPVVQYYQWNTKGELYGNTKANS